MGEQNPVGRRRRAPDPRIGAVDDPAPHSVMASVWRAVSRVQEVLGRHLLEFGHTTTDERLSEQLSLLAVLHDWHPVTESEALDLVYLLGLYVEPAGNAGREDVARTLTVTIRTMAVQRASGGLITFGEAGI